MSTEATPPELKPTPVESPLNMKELTALLIKHYGIREGMFDLMVEYQLGTGAVGPDNEHLLPGLMIGIAKVGLMPSTKANSLTVDAFDVNPSPKTRKRS
jgi:hypothetical protein